jgi:hypothetical protein
VVEVIPVSELFTMVNDPCSFVPLLSAGLAVPPSKMPPKKKGGEVRRGGLCLSILPPAIKRGNGIDDEENHL